MNKEKYGGLLKRNITKVLFNFVLRKNANNSIRDKSEVNSKLYPR